jgi:hypothetical protein
MPFGRLLSKDVHGNGNGGNTAGTGTNFTVLPRERVQCSRYYRGNGNDLYGNPVGTVTVNMVGVVRSLVIIRFK